MARPRTKQDSRVDEFSLTSIRRHSKSPTLHIKLMSNKIGKISNLNDIKYSNQEINW